MDRTDALRKNLLDRVGSDHVWDAVDFATSWFEGVLRKDGEDFINHQLRVAIRCADAGLPWSVVQAAVCHDVWEDENQHGERCRYDQLRPVLCDLAFDAVLMLTSMEKLDDRLSAAPRAERKRWQREILYRAPLHVKMIKIFDRIDNLSCMRGGHFTEEFVRQYLGESVELVCRMVLSPKAGSPAWFKALGEFWELREEMIREP